MPIWARRTAFILALLQLLAWICATIAEAVKTREGETAWETNQEIIMWYMVVIHVPQAVISAGTIVFASLKGELSGDNGYRPPIPNKHDGEHLPESPKDEQVKASGSSYFAI